MNLQLSVTKGETSVSVVLENTSNEYATETVSKVFGFFGSNQVTYAPKIVTKQEEQKVDVQTKKPIEKINSERTLMQPLAEKLSAALGIPTPDETEKEDINADIDGRWPYSKYRDGKEYFKWNKRSKSTFGKRVAGSMYYPMIRSAKSVLAKTVR